MKKYLELFKEGFPSDMSDRTAIKNWPYVGHDINGGIIYTVVPKPADPSTYVTFKAEEDNSSIGLSKLSANQTLEYSTDTATWNTFNTTTNISLNNGDKVYVRGILSADNTSSNYTKFMMTGKISASGNCNAIWNYQDLNAPLKAYCGSRMFDGCSSLTTAPELPATILVKDCYNGMFWGCTSLNYITCLATDISATNCVKYWVREVASTGTFYKQPNMNDWSTGDSGIPEGWIIKDTYTPQECVKLEITADNVSGRKTNTTIYYTATTNGIDYKGDRVEGQIITGTATSNEFEQNKSYTDTVERTVTFEFMGVTATTTITQGVWVDKSRKVVLNDQWRLSQTQSNPDSTLYDGVYESFANKGVNNSTAVMYLDLIGYTEFDVYIRSYAESSYDYVTISEPNTTTEKATTKGKQNSGQAISSYTKVHYDNLTGDDRITITYRKDDSSASGNDQGYVLIPKQ